VNLNVEGVAKADVVILGCKPHMVDGILGNYFTKPKMWEALKGKLIISICAGLTIATIESNLYSPALRDPSHLSRLSAEGPRFVRAMPNTASLVGQSMTVLHTPLTPLSEEQKNLMTWIFQQVGRVSWLPNISSMDPPTALCGSGTAFGALVIEAMADGAVAMGLPRKEAIMMAAQTMLGAAALVLEGEHPAMVKDKVATPGGCTLGGLMVLEEGGARGVISRAVREATTVAAEMGGGKGGFNTTRK
jgi:pyrroline-5-carboxylate reductase